MIRVEHTKPARKSKAVAKAEASSLPAMVRRAADQLASATTAAEILDAKDAAGLVYDAAKRSARIHKAKGAHDTLIATAHRAQADALEIEAQAKRRLADEYDAAQERGDLAKKGRPENVPNGNIKAKASEAGLTRKQIHDARQVRDAEAAEPGVIRKAVDEKLDAGEEPTRAAVNAAVAKTLSKDKPTAPVDARTDVEREADTIQSTYDRASEAGRALFLTRNNLSSEGEAPQPPQRQDGRRTEASAVVNSQAKASVDNGATVQGEQSQADGVTGDASRPSRGGGTPASIPEPDGGAIGEVKGKARLPDAAGVEPSPSVTFDNPRCQNRGSCTYAHSRSSCFDCTMAWSQRPVDEQKRLWAEAIGAAA